MEYVTPSPDSEDSAYLTLLTATILVSAIEEIMGVSWTVMFPNGYSGGISTWTSDEEAVDRTFHHMVSGFPRLEEFGEQGPDEVHQ